MERLWYYGDVAQNLMNGFNIVMSEWVDECD